MPPLCRAKPILMADCVKYCFGGIEESRWELNVNSPV
jgi:hypothetical protein